MNTNQLTVTELINATRKELLRTGYIHLSLIERVWLNFQEYLQGNGNIYFTRDVGMSFLEKRYHFAANPHSHYNEDCMRAIQLLEDFQAHQKVFIRRKNCTYGFAEPFEPLFHTFMEFRKGVGITSRTLESY